MATIRNRGKYQYQVLVRRKGHPQQTRTFETRAQAEAWAREIETQIDKGRIVDRRQMAQITLKDALARYLAEVTPTKAPTPHEANRIARLMRHPIAQRTMDELRAADFTAYRDERRKAVSGTAVRLELAVFSHLYTIAIKEWSWPLVHELKNVRKPQANAARERRLSPEEFKKLMEGVHREGTRTTGIWLDAAIRLALETGMRPGEILKAKWEHVDLKNRWILLPMTKNKHKRLVPLSQEAVAILRQLPRNGEKVISAFHDVNGMGDALRKACKHGGLHDFKFHDLRHEAASRLAPHMKPLDLAKIFGWKNIQMAMRYYNPTGAEVVNILDRAKESAEVAQRRQRESDVLSEGEPTKHESTAGAVGRTETRAGHTSEPSHRGISKTNLHKDVAPSLAQMQPQTHEYSSGASQANAALAGIASITPSFSNWSTGSLRISPLVIHGLTRNGTHANAAARRP